MFRQESKCKSKKDTFLQFKELPNGKSYLAVTKFCEIVKYEFLTIFLQRDNVVCLPQLINVINEHNF